MTTAPMNLFGAGVQLADKWQVRAHRVETDADVHADHWEIHPDDDEVVACLTGGMRLYLRPQGPADHEVEAVLPAGTAVVVPGGRWHRIELDSPSELLAITVAKGSRLQKREEP